MFCPNCGNKLNGNETFCSNCGNKVVVIKEQNNATLSETMSKKVKTFSSQSSKIQKILSSNIKESY